MSKKQHIAILAFTCLIGFTLSANAENQAPTATTQTPPAGQTTQATTPTPDVTVQQALQEMMAFLYQQPKPERKDIALYLDQKLAPLFDWNYMARVAGGRLYEKFNSYQKGFMAEDIKRRLLTQMVTRMSQKGVYNMTFLPTRVSPQGDMAVVGVEFMEPARLRPAKIDLYLQFDPAGWAIVDIVANGVSALSWYRDQLLIEARYQNYTRRRN